jgi:acyl-CoA synthetase (AMP-forming)/AMP-acid ligase II
MTANSVRTVPIPENALCRDPAVGQCQRVGQRCRDPQSNVVMSLMTGAPLVILVPFSTGAFWPAVREHGATSLYVLGTMPQLMLKQPLDPLDRTNKVRMVLCSGIVPGLHQALEERRGAPWRQAYGMTEADVSIATRSWETDTGGYRHHRPATACGTVRGTWAIS